MEDVLEENQEHLGRSEEDSDRISLQKATNTEKYYLSGTVDYLNKTNSEEVQENGLRLFPNSITSRTKIRTDGTNKWEKQEVKLDQTDAKLKTNDSGKVKEKKTLAVIYLFEGKRDTKEDYMDVKEEGITETLSQKTKQTGSHKEMYNVALPLATLFTHSEIPVEGSFEGIPVLKRLYLDRNQLQSLPTDLPMISGSLPPGALSSLHNLRTLNLGYNRLASVPRRLPAGLHSVALAHNKIESVPSNAFCWGSQSLSLSRPVHVRLEHNLIDVGKLDVRAFRCLRRTQVVHFH
uniref:Podocan-like protein 1 n=1 Tax=Poecilia reticulata TaxID=8081 RepID=A0A3P9MYS9_POERE